MSGGTNVTNVTCYNRWDKCHHLAIGGTNVSFLVIGGTFVNLVKCGTNVRWNSGT
jgi:hypothetical protein